LLTHHINRLWKFQQICNYGAVGHEDELVSFRGQKVKGHSEIK